VSTSIVVNRGEVETFVCAWSWDLHCIKKGKATWVSTSVRNKVFLFTVFPCSIVIGVLDEKIEVWSFCSTVGSTNIICLSEVSCIKFSLVKTVVTVLVPVVSECEYIVIFFTLSFGKSLWNSLKTKGGTRPEVISSCSSECVVCEVGIITSTTESDSRWSDCFSIHV
jgi:hypothetical protein